MYLPSDFLIFSAVSIAIELYSYFFFLGIKKQLNSNQDGGYPWYLASLNGSGELD